MNTPQLEQDWLDVRRILLQGAAQTGSTQPVYQQKKDNELFSLLTKEDREFEKMLQQDYSGEYN